MLGLMVAGSASAQTPGPPPPPPSGTTFAPPPRAVRPIYGGQLFIAPSGEPFHAADGAPYPVADWFAATDRNHDGRIDQGEFVAGFMRFFDSLDVDHDGMLRQTEIERYEQEVAPEVQSGPGAERGFRPRDLQAPGGQASEDDGSGPKSADVGQSSEIESDLKAERPTGGGRFGLINIPEPIASMDTDFTGQVTRTEAQAAAARRFALLDPDGKGYLTLADLPATWVQQHGRGRASEERRRKRR